MENAKRATILVTEDDIPIRQFISWMLELEGYQVIKAESGETALYLLHKLAVDLVIMDLRLPNIDGLTVVRRMRNDPELAQIPVLVISATATEQKREEAMKLGVVKYLVKPLGVDEISKAVYLTLRKRGVYVHANK